MLRAPVEDKAIGIIMFCRQQSICSVLLPRNRGVKPFLASEHYIKRARFTCSLLFGRTNYYGDNR